MNKTISLLKDFLRPLCPKGIALAFSGGVDSTLLLAVLSELKKEQPFNFMVFYIQSVFQNEKEIETINSICRGYNTIPILLHTNPLSVPEIKNNTLQRCYFCKKDMFICISKSAQEKGIHTVIDGTNADDMKTFRPGLKALQELHILSPLAVLGISKKMIRETAVQMGLKNALKPSVPCCATRFEYNTELNMQMLQRIKSAENFLYKLFPQTCNIRLRVHNNIARIEIDRENFASVLQYAQKITQALKEIGFSYVVLDLEGFRSGSMDITGDFYQKQIITRSEL